MPDTNQIRKAQERREARAQQRDLHAEQALQQDQDLAALSELQSKPDYVAPPRTPQSRMSRADQIAAKRAAAEVQADRDSRRMPEPVDTVSALQRARDEGREPTLHELNALAKEASSGIRNDAREIATAAGKAAFDVAIGKNPERSRHSRFNRIRQAESLVKQTEGAST